MNMYVTFSTLVTTHVLVAAIAYVIGAVSGWKMAKKS